MGRVEGEAHQPGEVLLSATGLEVRDALQVLRLSGVNLELRAGEMVGIAGVSGNGQSELLDVLSGLLTPTRGELTLRGQRFEPPHWLDPQTARSLGLAHVPEDRHARALVMDFAAWESAVLGYDGLAQYCSGPWMRSQAMHQATADMMERFDVRPRDTALRSANFSGGNQQKLVLARELGRAPQVLLVGQPTRGVDIGAIEFIYSQLRAMRDAGCAVLVVSEELEELFEVSDRLHVIARGRLSPSVPIAQATVEKIGEWMSGLWEEGGGANTAKEVAHA
jgi:simple sugar transport system ATP-binding protein